MLLCTLHGHTETDCTAAFEVLTAVLLKALALWVVTLFRLESKFPTVPPKRLFLLVPSIIRGQAVQDPFKTARS